MKALKWLLWALGGLILLLVLVGVYVAATFDPEEYKPRLVQAVKERTGRTLSIDGPISLSFFPKIGASVEQAKLSAPNSAQAFAEMREARVALALFPLLSGNVVADRIVLTDLRVDLVRYKDGSTNFDDLLKGEEEKNKPSESEGEKEKKSAAVFDIGGITLKNANIGWRDESKGSQLRLSKVDMETGHIASGVPGEMDFKAKIDGNQPKLALLVEASSDYLFDLQSGAFRLTNLDLKAQGDVGEQQGLDVSVKADTLEIDRAKQLIDLVDLSLKAASKAGLKADIAVPKLAIGPERSEVKTATANLGLVAQDRRIDLKLSLSALSAKGKQLQFQSLSADLDFKQNELALTGKMGSPVELDLDAGRVRLGALKGEMRLSGPNIPNKSATLNVSGTAHVDWTQQKADAKLNAKLDDSNIRTRFAVVNFDSPVIDFDIDADKLDLDRYRSTPLPEKTPQGGAAKPAASEKAATEDPIKLDALNSFDARGEIKVGALGVAGLSAQAVNLRVALTDGRLNLNPMSARLYDGTLTGSVGVDAHRNAYSIEQRMSGINVGPLLRDLADKNLLEGRGDISLDVRTVGTTPTALKRALDGNGKLLLKDGALKGVNLAQLFRKAKALLGSESAAEEIAQGGEKTDFSDLSASFNIRDGVARNEDLLMRSPFLRVTGSGEVDIGHSSMDYLAKVSIVSTSTGQEGKELAELRGLTAPVRVSGPLDALKYRVDTGALVKDAAKEALARELEKRLGGDKQSGEAKPGEKKPKRGEQLLRDLLKK